MNQRQMKRQPYTFTANLSRYYCQVQNEPTRAAEDQLESMLQIMSMLSREYFRPIDGYYCRAIAWVKTAAGENHLILTASNRVKQSTEHGEESLVKTLHALYQRDKTVIDDGTIKLTTSGEGHGSQVRSSEVEYDQYILVYRQSLCC